MAIENEKEFLRITKRFSTELVPQAAQKVTAALFIAALGMVVSKTAVNTGRARGNWQSSIGSWGSTVLETKDRSGNIAKARGTAVATAAKPFSVLYLANNVPQILVLERGGYIPADPPTDDESLKKRAARRSELDQKRATLIAGGPGAPLVRGGYPIQAPRGMVAVSIVELKSKADQIIALAVPKSRRG